MRLVEHDVLISAGDFPASRECADIVAVVKSSIASMVWPPGSDSFTLYEEFGKEAGKGNGVTPIKKMFMSKLQKAGWSLETDIDVATFRKPGAIDASFPCRGKLFCVEWETGNISSSHRALNKLTLGMMREVIIGGILILPTRAMYRYLTDRVGNYSEIQTYFALWEALPVKEGYLAVMAIEHDYLSKKVPRFPKGTDGRAKR
jgi:hypothetical protein